MAHSITALMRYRAFRAVWAFTDQIGVQDLPYVRAGHLGDSPVADAQKARCSRAVQPGSGA